MPKRSFPPRDGSIADPRPVDDTPRTDATGPLPAVAPPHPATGTASTFPSHPAGELPRRTTGASSTPRPQPPVWAMPRPDQPVRPAHPIGPEPATEPPATETPATEAPAPQPRRTGRRARSGRRDQHQHELIERIRRRLDAAHQVAVVSLKGGVGRTTTVALLGLALAEHRTDRVIAVDASPAGGTLADRLLGPPATGIRDLLERFDEVRTLEDVQRFSGVVGRLRVLASDQSLARNVPLNSLDYERVCLLLQRHFPVIVTDGAAGPALPGTLAMAHSVIVVGSLTVDGAVGAGKTLDWLVAHGYRDAAARTILVLDGDRASAAVDAERLRAHFAARCRAVLEIPHDPHLAQGGRIDVGALAPSTRDAVLELAAMVADEFGTVTTGRR